MRFLLRDLRIALVAVFWGLLGLLHAQGGDDCAQALANPLTLPAVIVGHTTQGFTNDYTSGNTPSCVNNSYKEEPDRLYAFTPTCSGVITISFQVTAACGNWTSWGGLYVYQGCPNTGTCIGFVSTSPNPATFTFNAIGGNTYFLWIDSWTCGAATGWVTYNLNVSAPAGGSFISPVSDNGYWISHAPAGGPAYNDYASVISIPNPTTLEVDEPALFQPCDVIMILQMKGADVSLANDPTYGTVTNMNLAGRYQLNQVQSVSCFHITLFDPILLPFDRNDIVQVIRIPYDALNPNVTLTGNYAVPAFNGRKGGVMVALAPNTLTLNNVTINARGRGYRGGNSIGSAWGCASVPIPPPYFLAGPDQGPAGAKGESFTRTPVGHQLARGAMGHAGGAGLNVNGGGGGGSSGGAGGVGGWDWISCSPRNDALGGGIPGHLPPGIPLPMFAPVDRLLAGGGGGSAHAGDNVANGGDGGSGGGVVFFIAPTINLIGNNSIDARGADATNVNGQWAGGGGGAGGMVVLMGGAVGTGTLTINTSGGRGGNAYWPNQLGPGGGGGGGRLLTTMPALPPAVTHISDGGPGGWFCGPCNNSPYGNADGSPGTTETQLFGFAVNIPPCIPMSQSELTLQGRVEGDLHVLEWRTTLGLAKPGTFYIEVSTDAQSFSTQAALSERSDLAVYRYLARPLYSHVFYRIRLQEPDGSPHFSNVIELSSLNHAAQLIRNGQQLILKDYEGPVEIYNTLGQILARYEENPVFIDLGCCKSGSLLLIRAGRNTWRVMP